MKTFILALTIALASSYEMATVLGCAKLISNHVMQEDTKYSKVVKDTRHPKENTEDKARANMLSTCVQTISKEELAAVEQNQFAKVNVEEVLDFKDSVFFILGPDLKFTEEEDSLLNSFHSENTVSSLFSASIIDSFKPREKTWKDRVTLKNIAICVLLILLVKSFFEKKEEPATETKKEQ